MNFSGERARINVNKWYIGAYIVCARANIIRYCIGRYIGCVYIWLSRVHLIMLHYRNEAKGCKATGKSKNEIKNGKRCCFPKIRLINSIENAAYAKLNSTTHYCHLDFNGKLSHLISSVILFTLEMSAHAFLFVRFTLSSNAQAYTFYVQSNASALTFSLIFAYFHNFQFHYTFICFVTHSFLSLYSIWI